MKKIRALDVIPSSLIGNTLAVVSVVCCFLHLHRPIYRVAKTQTIFKLPRKSCTGWANKNCTYL